MSFTIQYAVRVFEDMQNAYNYYIEQNALQAAENFLQELQNTFDTIKINPYTYTIRYADVRCAVTKIFPYLVHYKIIGNEQTVLIVAVANTHQKPIW